MNVILRMLTLGGILAAASAILFAALVRPTIDRSDLRQGNSRARVTCLSGGTVILDDFASGKVETSDSGYLQFRSATTSKRKRASGDCVIDYAAKRPADFKVLP